MGNKLNPFESPQSRSEVPKQPPAKPGPMQRRIGFALLGLGLTLGAIVYLFPGLPVWLIGAGPVVSSWDIARPFFFAMGLAIAMILSGALLAGGRRWW